MKIDVPFGYTSLTTLKILLWLEGKKEVSLDVLKRHREFMLDRALSDYKKEKEEVWGKEAG